MAKDTILIVDDESTIRWVLSTLVSDMGCEAVPAGSAEEALDLMRSRNFTIALIDIVLPGMNGIELLSRIKASSPETEVLVMTSNASIDTAIEALRRGAYDYFHKPFEIEEVAATLSHALEKRRLTEANRRLREEQSDRNEELSTALRRIGSLYTASIGMNGIQSLDELLDFLIDVVATELGVDRASVMLTSIAGDEMTIAASRGIDPGIVETARVPVGDGIAGKVVQSGAPILVKDVNEVAMDSAPKPHLGDSFLSAPIMLSVPIKGSQHVLGVINLTNRANGKPFDEQDLAHVSGLAALAAIAIERARRSDELRTAVDQLRNTQEELVRAARIAAVGKMAAGVANDFNETLNGILGRAEMLLASVQDVSNDPDRLGRNLERIVALARQSAESIKRIQDFSKVRKPNVDENDLSEIVQATVDETRKKWSEDTEAPGAPIAFESDLQSTPSVRGDTSDLGQMLDYLVRNAIEAMPDGGRIEMRTWEENGYACVSIRDTGVGMNEETQRRMFEPFFSSKESGYGLGLSVVHGIVTRLQGTIDVESREGQGTQIVIRLPGEAAAPASTPATIDPEAAAAIRVLVVEENEEDSKRYCQMLLGEGFDAEVASTEQEFIMRFGQAPVDAVITNVKVGERSGLDIARAVKDLSPQAAVILLTRRAADLGNTPENVDRVLCKPISSADLVGSVVTVCSGRFFGPAASDESRAA